MLTYFSLAIGTVSKSSLILMEKHKQVIAEGFWNSSRISEQVEHTAPIALEPWQTQSVWYLFISIHILKSCLNSKLCKQANRRERKRNKKKPFIPFWLSPSSGWWWFGPQLPESLCPASLYLVRVLNEYCPFFKRRGRRQDRREKIKAEPFKVTWFSASRSAFISL